MSCGPYDHRSTRRAAAEMARRERQRAMWMATMSGAVSGAVNGARGVPTGSANVRVGDAERESAVSALGEHYAAGRLTKDEFDERASTAWTARTGGELRPLFADLPALAPQPSPVAVRRRAQQRRAWRMGVRLWFVFVLLMVLATANAIPWFAVAIFAALWWTGAFAGLRRWTHARH